MTVRFQDRTVTTTRLTGQRRAMGSHQSARMGSDIWLTPRPVLTALGPFDLDPCSAPDQQIWPTAEHHYTLPTDGLSQPWFGRVWLNPPYGQHAWRWLAKLAAHGNGIALVFARTETEGFVREIWRKADAVLFLHGRLHFHHANGVRAGANSGAPSCLVAYGHNNVDALRTSGLDGSLVQHWASSEPASGRHTDTPVTEGQCAIADAATTPPLGPRA